jgi:hypothetical protein
MKATFSAYNLYTQEVDLKNDPPVVLKHANNIKIEITGIIENDELGKFPIVTNIKEDEYAIDIGYNIRILCDMEYLGALNQAIYHRKGKY